MLIVIMLLIALRETAGATFFLNYEGKTQTLICNASSHTGRADWWFGGQSTQTFTSRTPWSKCSAKQEKDHPCYTEGKALNAAFPHGQIVACKSRNKTKEPKSPLFTEEGCREYDFFILAKTKRIEQKPLRVNGKKFSLPCEFELAKNVAVFAVYWIKETDQTTCLLSVSNEGEHHIANFSYNTNCCVDANVRNRTRSGSSIMDSEGRHQNHEITIVDVTSSDSGAYLCVVTKFANPQKWMVVTNTSVIVTDPSSPTGSNYVLEISVGIVVAAVVLIGGIVLFLYWRKKTTGIIQLLDKKLMIALLMPHAVVMI